MTSFHTDPTSTDPLDVLEREPRKSAWVWWGYLVLYAIAIPWYWPAGYRGPLVLGLPTWVAVTLVAIVALALWTNFVIYRCWIDHGDGAAKDSSQ
ncbi:MAG: hypothetical protein HN712_30035 [Gemmatimonadetes bacterium]|jgi:hypothetical protein|nr:hypothetical protein [Gemmatimonadota bacterium]MBT6149699.1 hypothetical protein [Gemmatimonadota bacterium]MBT7864583.1 hypothetical protein [Gemmatimonadota bacterium]